MRTFTVEHDETFPEENARAVEDALQGFVETDTPLVIELSLVSEEEIRTLNRQMRQIDKVTDVLSFPTLDAIKGKPLCGKDYPFDVDEEGRLVIGSLAVCVKRAREQAEEYGHSYERELNYLLVHGVMHCLGYDHMTDDDKAEMREQEERILKKMRITR